MNEHDRHTAPTGDREQRADRIPAGSFVRAEVFRR